MIRLLTLAGVITGSLALTGYGINQLEASFCNWQETYATGIEMSGEKLEELDECMMGQAGYLYYSNAFKLIKTLIKPHKTTRMESFGSPFLCWWYNIVI